MSAIAFLTKSKDGTERYAHTVWALAWPAVALNSLQVVNTLLDRAFIGHLPVSALTAHGGAISVMFLVFSLAMALSTGATALVSRAFGAEQVGEYRAAAQNSLSLSIVCGIAFGALSFLIAPFAAAAILPASDHEAIQLMADFTRVYAVGLPGIFVIQVLAGCLRSIGDTKSPMVISGVQIVLHASLNVCLVPAPGIPWHGLGLVGAASALTISATLSAMGYLWYVKSTPLGRLSAFRIPRMDWSARILKIAIPTASMACLRVFSLTAFTLILALTPNGSNAIAAMTTGFAIESVMFMPAFGLSVSAAALVGQSLGMKRTDRAEALGWTAAFHGALVTLGVAMPIYFLARPIANLLLGGRSEVVDPAVTLLHYLCITEVGFGYAMVLMGALQGAGDTKRPMWITIFALWGLRVPLALLLALPGGIVLAQLPFATLVLPIGIGLGATGAWIAMAMTQGLQGVLAYFAFKGGAWQTQKV